MSSMGGREERSTVCKKQGRGKQFLVGGQEEQRCIR